MKEGTQRLATETGAGQWGSALAFAAMMFGLKATVYMVRASYDQKPYRKMMMNLSAQNASPAQATRLKQARKYLLKTQTTKAV
jgi:tryptophan synthase beta chain